MKKIVPFSNATEATSWLFHNCDKCKRWQCSSKVAIQKGFISGEITESRANWIGYHLVDGKFFSLFSKCGEFLNKPIPKKNPNKPDNEPKLF